MTRNLMMEECVGVLRNLYPIKCLVHVGDVGKHVLSDCAEQMIERAIFIIADEKHYNTLTPLIEAQPGWSGIHAVVADSVTERDYHVASNPRESGLLPPESLAGIWRNIKTLSRHRVRATTLDSILAALPGGTPANWLVINTLSALPVVQGGDSCLDECDVIIARAVLEESLVLDPSMSLSSLDEHARVRGFRRVAVDLEPHPALGSVVYVRDSQRLVLEYKQIIAASRASLSAERNTNAAGRQLIEKLTLERDEQARLAGLRATECERVHRENGEISQLAEDRQHQLDNVGRDRDRIAQELVAQRTLKLEHDAAIAEITVQRDDQTRLAIQRANELERVQHEFAEQARLAAERQAQLDQVSRERDEQTRLAAERANQIEQLVRETVDLAHLAEERLGQLDQITQLLHQRSSELEQALKELDTGSLAAQETQIQIEQSSVASNNHAQLLRAAVEKIDTLTNELIEVRAQTERGSSTLKDRDARIAELESERDDVQSRQLRLDREILKAEAQIELIKDVILRDKAF